MREERKVALAALAVLALCLEEIAEKTGELKIEARRVRLLRLQVEANHALDRALEVVSSVTCFVYNWADCARPTEAPADAGDRYESAAFTLNELMAHTPESALHPVIRAHVPDLVKALKARGVELGKKPRDARYLAEEEFEEQVLVPARKAGDAAVDALCALVDGMIRDSDR